MSLRALAILCGHSLRRIRAILVGLVVLLAVFQFLLTQVGAYFVRHSAFGQLWLLLPDFFRDVAGPTALAFMSFTGVVAFGYFHPIVIAAVVGLTIAIATEPAAEVETRFVDLTLARALTRGAVIARTGFVFLFAASLMLGLMTLSTAAGIACCTPSEIARPGAALILSLAISLGSVMVCWAGVALALAAAVRRRVVAGAIAGVAALAAFLLDYLGRVWEPARAISVVSPFHYFEPTQLILGQPLNPTNVAVLLGIGAAGGLVAYVVFSRRDI